MSEPVQEQSVNPVSPPPASSSEPPTPVATKTGMAPGSCVYVGRIAGHIPVSATVLMYTVDGFDDTECRTLEELLPVLERAESLEFSSGGAEGGQEQGQNQNQGQGVESSPLPVVWIHLHGVHQTPWVLKIAEVLGLPKLVIEDILDTTQRPKVEVFPPNLFIQLKHLEPAPRHVLAAEEQVSVWVGRHVVVSFQESDQNRMEPIRERIRHSRWRERQLGSDYLAYAIVDILVDGYMDTLRRAEALIELSELDVFGNSGNAAAGSHELDQVFELRRSLIQLKRQIVPVRDMVRRFLGTDGMPVGEEARRHFQDVEDHLAQVVDGLDTCRAMLESAENRCYTAMSHRMNQTMQLLTVFATVFMPLTFITGVYGMNFEHMPELAWPWAYGVVWAVMIMITVCLAIYFKRKRFW